MCETVAAAMCNLHGACAALRACVCAELWMFAVCNQLALPSTPHSGRSEQGRTFGCGPHHVLLTRRLLILAAGTPPGS